MICKTQRVLDAEAQYAAHANQLGIPAQVLDSRGLAQLDPQITVDAAGGVYFPKDCHLIPERLMARLKQIATRAGVQFAWNTPVTGFAHQGSFITTVRTRIKDFHGDEIVLAGGAWTAVLARGLQLNLPLQAGKGYALTLNQPRQLPSICAILTEARVAITPMAGRLRFAGTMEITGLREQINPRRLQGIIKNVPKYYPAFSARDFAGVTPWCGLRPCTPDGLPYLGRTKRFSNLVVACGHAMMGLSLGPITGRLVSEIVSGETPAFDLRGLSPDRYP